MALGLCTLSHALFEFVGLESDLVEAADLSQVVPQALLILLLELFARLVDLLLRQGHRLLIHFSVQLVYEFTEYGVRNSHCFLFGNSAERLEQEEHTMRGRALEPCDLVLRLRESFCVV